MQQIADKVGGARDHRQPGGRRERWIEDPLRGIFPLKRFFCGGTVSAGGEEVAWDTIRLKLQELIDNEDKQHPKSDDQLVQGSGRGRGDGGPPHGDQVPQGDEHPQFAVLPRLERKKLLQRPPEDDKEE